MKDFALPPSDIALRKMKSRWGSCSRKGKITLNTQLVRYPMACIDAVVVHELCHLLEFNHSRRFYDLMDRAYPQWRAVDKLLKDLALQY
jgi:predicted metal-dependent hydrolase